MSTWVTYRYVLNSKIFYQKINAITTYISPFSVSRFPSKVFFGNTYIITINNTYKYILKPKFLSTNSYSLTTYVQRLVARQYYSDVCVTDGRENWGIMLSHFKTLLPAWRDGYTITSQSPIFFSINTNLNRKGHVYGKEATTHVAWDIYIDGVFHYRFDSEKNLNFNIDVTSDYTNGYQGIAFYSTIFPKGTHTIQFRNLYSNVHSQSKDGVKYPFPGSGSVFLSWQDYKDAEVIPFNTLGYFMQTTE